MQEYLTHSEAETEQAGADFARALPDGEVVAMYGELGSGKTAFVRGMAVCLMNPKAYLFMLAVFPQFVRPEYGPIAVQAAVLGAMTAAVQTVVYGAVALAASRARGWLAGSGRSQVILARAIGPLLMSGAVWSAWSAWRG